MHFVCDRSDRNTLVDFLVQLVLNLLSPCLALLHVSLESGCDLLGAHVSILDHVILDREHILLEGQDLKKALRLPSAS